ncbi:hypothetical protein F2Q69_00059429 [Brassica cretica]|uniref:Uncharacterized protein n=1 Tax=Brassica cretica TaxID=69181 RepID=A0A8S9RGM2_BRACR|nr:hypothetical protein F2Q69_00059429 [Brassica cretica]
MILDQMKEMFASAQKKSDKQGKLAASLAKQVETLTAKARRKAPRGTTRARSGRRLDFETPGNRDAHADKASSGQNPDETLQPGAQPTAENLPPPTGSNEGEEIERIDLDISDQSDHSNDGADIHPRRTRSQSARQDASFEKPMTEEEENLYWLEVEEPGYGDPERAHGLIHLSVRNSGTFITDTGSHFRRVLRDPMESQICQTLPSIGGTKDSAWAHPLCDS